MNIHSIRSSKKARLWIIGILVAIAAFLLITAKSTTVKAILAGAIALLLVSFGMEASNHDYDVQKLMKTGSFAESKIERDQKGNLINIDGFCNAQKINYNCTDFKNQEEAMSVYNRCTALGKNMDIFGLDRDHDGKVCESLPVHAK